MFILLLTIAKVLMPEDMAARVEVL